MGEVLPASSSANGEGDAAAGVFAVAETADDEGVEAVAETADARGVEAVAETADDEAAEAAGAPDRGRRRDRRRNARKRPASTRIATAGQRLQEATDIINNMDVLDRRVPTTSLMSVQNTIESRDGMHIEIKSKIEL